MAETDGSSKLKIIYIIARFHPFKGGAEQNCYQLATRMAVEGHDVSVFTTDAKPVGSQILPTYEEIAGIKVTRFHRLNQQLDLGFYPMLLLKLLQTPADIVHVENGPGILWQDFCVLLKKLFSRKTKFIVTPHGPFLATPYTHSGFTYLVARTAKAIMWPFFRLFWTPVYDLFIQVNPKQYLWLQKTYGVNINRIKLLPNGIPSELLTEHKQLELDAANKVVLTFVGRLAKYKGVHQVMFVLHWLIAHDQIQREQIKFIVMGQGDYYNELLQLSKKLELEDVVEFKVNPSDQERDDILAHQSQIHILPSEWEATGIVLIEAMAGGNALVTTSTNEGAQMLIDNGVNGFIYDYDDLTQLCQILGKLISDDKLRQEMIQTNLVRAKNFTWESIFPDYLKMLAELTSNA